MEDIALPQKKSKKNSKFLKYLIYVGLGIGILGLIFGLIPNLNSYGIWLAIIALAIGLLGFFHKAGKYAKYLLILGGAALLVSLVSVSIQNNLFWNSVDSRFSRQDGSMTDYLLKNDVDISFGEFTAEGMGMTIKNRNSERKSYGILVDAKNEAGEVITNQSIDTGGIASGAEKKITIFSITPDWQLESMKKAKFEITKVSQY
ncbi:MAG: hypothetical protein LBL08_01665 [Candidatus Nomurabacteria bacterium]|jgi:hypothetical protein|nr:hypothetical protein [Candidatus Nomurabacteria bacterium]